MQSMMDSFCDGDSSWKMVRLSSTSKINRRVLAAFGTSVGTQSVPMSSMRWPTMASAPFFFRFRFFDDFFDGAAPSSSSSFVMLRREDDRRAAFITFIEACRTTFESEPRFFCGSASTIVVLCLPGAGSAAAKARSLAAAPRAAIAYGSGQLSRGLRPCHCFASCGAAPGLSFRVYSRRVPFPFLFVPKRA